MTDTAIDRNALSRLLEVIGGDTGDLAELLEDYRATAPDLAGQIGAAAAAGDTESLRIAAHTLKSNARDFGATRLAALCQALELECREGAPADPSGAAAAIAAEEETARAALAQIDIRSLGS